MFTLSAKGSRNSSSYMRATLTISLPPELRREMGRAAKGQGVSESEFVRRAVQHELWTEAFNEARRLLVPKARAKGVYTDDDVFKIVS
jgi:Arc/MetJ-type ribon-helix-helix transcriptional regulator